MATKKWRLVITHLSGETPLHEAEVEASNWMGALRAGRQAISEDGGVPPGASCAVAPDGAVTILDPSSRRRFLLTPDPGASSTSVPAQTGAPAPAAAAQPTGQAPAPAKKAKFQTVAYVPDQDRAAIDAAVAAASTKARAGAAQAPVAQAPAPQPAPQAAPAPQTAPAGAPKKKPKFQTVAFSPDEWRAQQAAAQAPAAQPPAAQAQPPARSSTPAAAPRPSTPSQPHMRTPSAPPLETVPLTLLLQRDEAPTRDNPLTYAERAYLLPANATVTQAEAALRFKLADIQQELSDRGRGQFINLAVFDHRWEDVPLRPPLVVIEWKDWKGAPIVDYPAADRSLSEPPAALSDQDERLADVFEALTELPHKPNASAALSFAVELLDRCLPSEAIGACLYDINTDDMRFVAAAGVGAEQRRGTAVPSNAGLLGAAAHGGDHAVAIHHVAADMRYDPEADGRPGLQARNQLLRPLVHEGHLVGILQLINRRDAESFSDPDVHLLNYVAERLSEFVYAVRMRRQSVRPPAP